MLTNKMVMDIDVFGLRGKSICIGDSTCTLIVTINWEGFNGWKFGDRQKKINPDSLFKGVS